MSSGGGSSGGAQNNTSEIVLPEWAQTQAQQNLAQANELASQPYTAYGGPTVAGFSPDQLTAQSAVENLPGMYTGAYDTALSDVTNLPATTQSLLSPYMQGAETAATQQYERQGALNKEQLQANAIGQGALGGTREGVAEGMNDSVTQQNIASAINQISATGYNNAANTALSSAATLGSLATGGLNADLGGINALAATGSQQQTQQQAQYSDALQQWQAQQNYPYQQLAIEQSVLAGTPYGSTTTGQQPYSSNPALQYAGLGLAAVPAGIAAYNALAGTSAAGAAAAGTAAASEAAAGTAAAGAGASKGGAAAAAPLLAAAA